MFEPSPIALRRAAAVLVVAGLVAFCWGIYTDALAWLRGPAPFPEWEWPHAARPWTRAGWLPLGCGLGLLALVAGSGLALARRRPRASFALLLGAATALGTLFQLSLIGLSGQRPADYLLRRTFDASITSYYTVAASPLAAEPRRFLDHHAALLPGLARRAPHASTHPPGPVLYYRAWLALFQARARLATALVEGAPLDPELRAAARHRAGDPQVAAALSGAVFLVVLCVLSCWPLALWAGHLAQDSLAGARAGLMWPLVPGATLFAGSLDPALTLPVLLATWAGGLALAQRSERRRFVAALGAGAMAGLALQVSYGAAAFLGAGAVAVGAACLAGGERPVRVLAPAATALLAALLVLVAPTLHGHEPLDALRVALALHRELVTEGRSYGLWLVYNPIDFAVFLGPPLAGVVLARAALGVRSQAGGRKRAAAAAALPLLALLACTLLLWLSGLVRGEVGRLWVPLMGLVLAAACAAPARGTHPAHPTAGEAAALGASLLCVTFALRLAWGL